MKRDVIMVYRAINGLIRHAIEADLITNDDIFVVRNQLMDIPKTNYISVRGKGNTNEEDVAYQQTISVLYAVAYTLTLKNAARERSLQ